MRREDVVGQISVPASLVAQRNRGIELRGARRRNQAREERGRAEQEYVEVEARTLYEAVGLAIDRFRRREHVKIRVHGHLERVGPDDGGVGVLSGVSTACSLSLLW